jgi:hypothetical protein
MARGAEVSVLPGQAKPENVTEQMKREYLAGWFQGAHGGGLPAGSNEFERGVAAGLVYRHRERNGLQCIRARCGRSG